MIETTGLADPAPILQTLMSDPLLASRYRLDSVIVTVDGVNGAATMKQHIESVKQAAVADRLLVTKTDLIDTATAGELSETLRTINPTAPIHHIVDGKVDIGKLFNAGLYDPETKTLEVQRWLQEEAYREAGGHADDHHHAEHDHGHDVNRHGDDVRAFCISYDKQLDWDRFNSWIEMLITLYGSGLLRIKGILNVEGFERPLVIHGVQHVFHPPVQLEAWPDDDHRSRIVFITHGLEQEMFEHTLRAFNEDSADPLARRTR